MNAHHVQLAPTALLTMLNPVLTALKDKQPLRKEAPPTYNVTLVGDLIRIYDLNMTSNLCQKA